MSTEFWRWIYKKNNKIEPVLQVNPWFLCHSAKKSGTLHGWWKETEGYIFTKISPPSLEDDESEYKSTDSCRVEIVCRCKSRPIPSNDCHHCLILDISCVAAHHFHIGF